MERAHRFRHSIVKVKETIQKVKEAIPQNDSPARSFLTVASLGTIALIGGLTLDHPSDMMIYGYQTGITFPDTFMHGHTGDFLAATTNSALFSRLTGKKTPVLLPMATAVAGLSTLEVAQGLGLWGGTFDVKDFVAYIGGALLWLGIDRGAKKIQEIKTRRNSH